MRNSVRINLIEIIAALLIFLFVYTAISKLTSLGQFRAVLSRSPLLAGFSNFVSVAIPLAEIVIAILLFIPSFKRVGLLASAILMSSFTLYIAYMIIFMPTLPCSCGGVLGNLSWNGHLTFNCAITAMAFLGWRLSGSNKDFIAINRISRTPAENSRRID